MNINDPVSDLKGVGDIVDKKLKGLGINSVADLLYYFPRRYDDYSTITPIKRLKPGVVTIKATISQPTGRYARRGLHITEAIASDDSDSLRLIWFNQPYRASSIKPDTEYFISGEFGLHRQRMSMINPSAELASDFPINTARIVPIYRETKGLKSAQLRRTIKSATSYIDLLEESLPAWLIKEYKLMSKAEAYRSIHFPETASKLVQAKRRFGFEEAFELSLASLLDRQELKTEKALLIKFDEAFAKSFVANLPFKLTDEQRTAIWRVYLDMQKNQPMNRLIEGDVGTGKTVVATMSAVMVLHQGLQVAFMAPTELLARQHADTIYELLKPLGLATHTSLLIGSMSSDQKKSVYDRLKSGEISFIIGTHALIQDRVDFKKIGMVIIDEQQRFGVKQRQALNHKAGHVPHILTMTATPIPRSLQLTLYGDLDVTIIKHKPYPSKPIITKIMTHSQRPGLYQSIVKQVEQGRQVFVVCPAISQSNLIKLSGAEKVYKELSEGVFKKFGVGLLHGQLKTDERQAVVADFTDHKIDVLVATTIIEVGVNIPNAAVMVIEDAERFGLAQIHQLRGRVGRSDQQGYCYLLIDEDRPPSQRLRAVESTQDGFSLAELDLKIRGPGAVYATLRQHGQEPTLVDLSDSQLLKDARAAAQSFIDKKENLLQYSKLSDRVASFRAVTNLN